MAVSDILTTQKLTQAPTTVNLDDNPSGSYEATRLNVSDTTPACEGGKVLIAEGATSEERMIIDAPDPTYLHVEKVENVYTDSAYVTFLGRTNEPDPTGQTLVSGSTGVRKNGSTNTAEKFWNVASKDIKTLWSELKAFVSQVFDSGEIGSTTLTIGAEETEAGNRSLSFRLTDSLSRVIRWVHADLRFAMLDQADTLVRLAIADPTEPQDAVTKQTLEAEIDTVMQEIEAAIPAGTLMLYDGGTVPEGFLLCYGQAVSRTTYADLFAAIGTQHGAGDGSTTFNLSDWRGRTPIGLDNMGGVAANRITSASTNGVNSTTLGGTGGAETHTLSTAQLAAHSHSVNAAGASGNVSNTVSRANDIQTTINTDNTGGGSAHSNTQPWRATNVMIKT